MSQSTASAVPVIHLVCGHCDSVVRIPTERLEQGPKCPKCQHALFEGIPLARHLRRAGYIPVPGQQSLS